MIIRIVKMTFTAAGADSFEGVFLANAHKIRAFEGCYHVHLLRDKQQSNVFFTYSYWENEAALEAYRQSAIFANVWTQTKALFAAPAQAWTLYDTGF